MVSGCDWSCTRTEMRPSKPIVPTESLISAKKVKEGSCGKRITRFEVRDCFACRENSNLSASRA